MAINLASSFMQITINGNPIIGIAENITIELVNGISEVAYGIGTSATANTLFQKPVSYTASFEQYSLIQAEGNPAQFNFQDINNDGTSQIIFSKNNPLVAASDNAREFDSGLIILSGVGISEFNVQVTLNQPIKETVSFVALSMVMT